MTIENNVVIDIQQKLNRARKDRKREDGVIFSEGFSADRLDTGCPTHIEVYEGRAYLAGTAGLCVTVGSTSAVILLTAKEAIELGQALFQAAKAESLT